MHSLEPPQIAALQHELRNALSIILGSIEILRMNEPLSPNGTEDLDRMRRAGDRALAVVDALSTADPQP